MMMAARDVKVGQRVYGRVVVSVARQTLGHIVITTLEPHRDFPERITRRSREYHNGDELRVT